MLEADITMQRGNSVERVAKVPVPDGLAGFKTDQGQLLVDGSAYRRGPILTRQDLIRPRVLGVGLDEGPVREVSIAKTGRGVQTWDRNTNLVVNVRVIE